MLYEVITIIMAGILTITMVIMAIMIIIETEYHTVLVEEEVLPQTTILI